MIDAELQRTHRPNRLLASFGLAIALSASQVLSHAWACSENAMIVFDASASMGQSELGFAKIELARKALSDILPDVTKYRPTGLVIFGGSQVVSCSAVSVQVEPQEHSGRRIVDTLGKIQSSGATPLTDGVRAAASVLQRYPSPGIVVLITDGGENCGGSACALAHHLQDRGKKIRVHVIGLFLDGEATVGLHCLTEASNGTYVASNSLESLQDALRALLSCPQTSGLSGALP